jgi:alpha-L-fucosidase
MRIRAVAWAAATLVLCQPAGSGRADAPAFDPSNRVEWFRDARVGLFVDWSLNRLIPARTAAPREQQINGERLIAGFRGEHFDAAQWVALCKRVGARYLVVPAKPADGFCLYSSKHTDFDVMAAPIGRDVLAEFARVCRAEELKLGIYYSIPDYHHPDYRRGVVGSAGGPAYLAAYFTYVREQLRELCTGYQPDLLWLDGVDNLPDAASKTEVVELVAMCRKLRPTMIINDGGRAGDYLTVSQCCPTASAKSAGDVAVPWEAVVAVDRELSVGPFLPAVGEPAENAPPVTGADLIHALVDVVGQDGNLLIAVSALPNGAIAPDAIERLETVASWMFKNRSAIYGTVGGAFRHLPFHGRVTVNGKQLKVIVFEWPKDGTLRLPGLTTLAESARLLVGGANLTVKNSGADVLLSGLPAEPPDPIASVVEVDLASPPKVEPLLLKPDQAGVLELPAVYAQFHGRPGRKARLRAINGKLCTTHWISASDYAQWEFTLDSDGAYVVAIDYACPPDEAGSVVEFTVGRTVLETKVSPTPGTDAFESRIIGSVELPAGAHTLTVKAKKIARRRVMELNGVRLTRKGQ